MTDLEDETMQEPCDGDLHIGVGETVVRVMFPPRELRRSDSDEPSGWTIDVFYNGRSETLELRADDDHDHELMQQFQKIARRCRDIAHRTIRLVREPTRYTVSTVPERSASRATVSSPVSSLRKSDEYRDSAALAGVVPQPNGGEETWRLTTRRKQTNSAMASGARPPARPS